MSLLTGWKYKVVERNGSLLKHQLVVQDPWALAKCGRKDCAPCYRGGGDPINCSIRNVVYESYCVDCIDSEGNPRYCYVGETCRSVRERAKEHWRDYQNESMESHMWKQAAQVHSDQLSKPDFRFKVIKTFGSALERQIFEAVRIKRRSE